MDTVFNSYLSKKKNEIEIENLKLQKLVDEFSKKKNLFEQEKKQLENEYDNNKVELLNVNKEIDEAKTSNILKEFQNIQDKINLSEQEISKYNDDIILEIQEISLKNKIINEEIEQLEKDKSQLKVILNNKKDSKYFLVEKKEELIKRKEKLTKNLEAIIIEMKELKNKIKQEKFNNMERRQRVIEEYMKNIELKKRAEKEKENIALKIKESEEDLENFHDIKNFERQEILNNYNDKLNSGVSNILEEMDSIEETLRIFDLESAKEFYFLKNKIKSLKKKLENSDANLRKKIEIQGESNKDTYYQKIKALDTNKLNLEDKIRDIDIDVNFLDSEYNTEITDINNYFQEQETIFNKEKQLREENILQNNIQLTNFKNEKKLNIKNENETIRLLNNQLRNTKDKYYLDLKSLEIKKSNILKFQDNFSSKIKKNQNIFDKENEIFIIKKKDLENFILDLEKNYVELSIKQNELGK